LLDRARALDVAAYPHGSAIRGSIRLNTMRVAGMQPYFFPYIGYFQLMAACDVFFVFDDAQYIDGGWVNRNRILVNGAAQWITAPVVAASHKLRILEREYLLRHRVALRLPSRIAGAYRSAPFFAQTMPLIEDILAFPQAGVAAFNTNLLRRLAAHLGIKTPIRLTSELDKDDSLVGGERRVIDICLELGATVYINPIGGRDLYSAEAFAKRGIELRFLSCEVAPYTQFGVPHVPLLSIIDVLMFNDVPAVRGMLEQYTLLPGR
jgi:WbqC-like protein family